MLWNKSVHLDFKKGCFVSYKGKYNVMISAGCLVYLWTWTASACLVGSLQKKNHAFETNNMLHNWLYLYLKNDLTRSPSWDEHISFSRVSWPTNRQQVNTLFQFQYSHSQGKWTRRTKINLFSNTFSRTWTHSVTFIHKVNSFLHWKET